MKILSIFILFNVIISYAQSKTENLIFDTEFYEAVNKWVVMPKIKNDTTYQFGYIKLDIKEDFTFYLKNRLIKRNGKLKEIQIDPNSKEIMKTTFIPESYFIHILTQKEISELNLPDKPEVKSNYNKNSFEYLKNIGFKYNLFGANHIAIRYLLKAYELNPNDKSVIIELTYTYNKIKKYDKTIYILKKTLKKEPNVYPFYLYLGIAYKALGKIKNAEKTFDKGIKTTKNAQEKNNLFAHILTMFYEIKNKNKYKKWLSIYKRYSKPNSSAYKRFNEKLDKW